ncbi:MAG: hypothetical protein BWY68_00323 [bacterium ADurb.Bin400]|nr:MAG: hypothetical protein BWY68_00323 [bacterium ADurb.Bin400]
MGDTPYSTEIGQYLVIWITGCTGTYIAEIIQSDPLRLKVMDDGPYANLQGEDFIIRAEESARLQQDDRENTCHYLQSIKGKVVSGLKSLGVTDGQLHEILPAP